MVRKLTTASLMAAASVLVAAAGAQASPTQLVLSQGDAFSILGHWCGGIQEKVYATGFDATTGAPLGDVYMSTRCGGSGRGGGGHTTVYSAWASVTWGFDGQTSSFSTLSSTPTFDPGFSATDAHGDQLYDQNSQAYLAVLVPAAPTSVQVAPAGDQWDVSWTPDPTARPSLISSSTVTATPTGSTGSAITSTVTGSAASAVLGPLEPNTTYDLVVVSNDAAGPSAPSTAAPLTTGPSVEPPGAPTGIRAHWTDPGYPNDELVATWNAAPFGDSPTDRYRIVITASGENGGAVISRTVSGATLTTPFSVNDVPDWRVRVRAHDAAGWGPWSAGYTLGGT